MVTWYVIAILPNFYGQLVFLWPFGVFFPSFGLLFQEKSGNPGLARIILDGKQATITISAIIGFNSPLIEICT
jgi:hypothetical protein